MRSFPREKIKEFGAFKKLNSPAKIQDFLINIPFNFERGDETCSSPLVVLERGSAHCLEGAMCAAAVLWYHGNSPLLLDLDATEYDEPHVVALFKHRGKWGAVSKTNHAVLRYRDPVYASPRELAMSYFHEYFLENGKKTMRRYSAPFSLLKFGNDWLTSRESLDYINDVLDASRHFKILNSKIPLRKADPIERKAIKIPEWRS